MLDVQTNDAPAPGRAITALGTPDRGGTVTLAGDGTIRYTAAPTATGIETFTYTITTTGGWTATGVVAVGLGGGVAIFRNGFEN